MNTTKKIIVTAVCFLFAFVAGERAYQILSGEEAKEYYGGIDVSKAAPQIVDILDIENHRVKLREGSREYWKVTNGKYLIEKSLLIGSEWLLIPYASSPDLPDSKISFASLFNTAHGFKDINSAAEFHRVIKDLQAPSGIVYKRKDVNVIWSKLSDVDHQVAWGSPFIQMSTHVNPDEYIPLNGYAALGVSVVCLVIVLVLWFGNAKTAIKRQKEKT